MIKKITFLLCIIIPLSLLFSSCNHESDESTFSSDGVNIVFDKKGENEPTLILVHGFANDKKIWNLQMPYLSEKYRTIAIDLAGFGESGNNRSIWTIESFSNDVIAVINKFNPEQLILVGFSMGTPVVIETAKKIPESVDGIILVEGIHNVDVKVPPQVINYIDSVLTDLINNPTNDKLVKGGFYRKNQQESFQRVLSMIKRNPSRKGWKEALRNSIKWQNENYNESLSKIKTPIIAINSDQKPTDMRTINKYNPSFKLKLISDAGHVVMWDAPDEFNRLLDESINEIINN